MTETTSATSPSSSIWLVGVDGSVLDELERVAVSDASADEVTPRITPGDEWTADRVEWLREFHRVRRSGLVGVNGEATWAVTDGEHILGSVRLKRVDGLRAAEIGIWLARVARGQGAGRQAIAALLQRAGELGVEKIVADTAEANGAAIGVLRGIGFTIGSAGQGGRVQARLRLPRRSTHGR
ncbi:GNAT family N-acetyltransferase [Rhodococcus qingshengii]|uniref:GNAT family N-acetyltransferase n=1 Tax=Rhodococcus qingshengii TaxID=334542 RepID=UPI0036DBF042